MSIESAHRPSRTRCVRRPGSRTRLRLFRPLLGAALVVAGVLVPLEAPALPDSPVRAQDDGGVIQGTPEDCLVGTPRDRNGKVHPDGSLCILVVEACPYDPLQYDENDPQSPRLVPPEGLHPATDADGHAIGTYDGFCEARYLETADAVGYGFCTDRDRTKGFIVVTHVAEIVEDEEGNPVRLPVLDDNGRPKQGWLLDDDGNYIRDGRGRTVWGDLTTLDTRGLCRIIHPANCPVGSQVKPYECRAVRRRTWSCKDGYAARNEFNTCYKPLSRPSDTDPHPACGAGAPELVAVRCRDYAGTDYALSPSNTDWACDSARFSTGIPGVELSPRGANPYWCDFDASLLKVACHSNPQPAGKCTTTTASCLKRVSETGGCNAIADTIRCRKMQAEFASAGQAQKASKAEQIRADGCQPCVILPFESPPADCPADLIAERKALGEGNPQRARNLRGALAFKTSYYPGSGRQVCQSSYIAEHGIEDCARLPGPCADPPRGNLDWSSSHFSGLAIVNSPVVVNVTGLPASREPVPGYQGQWRPGDRPTKSFRYLTFPQESGSPLLKWPTPGENTSYEGVRQLVTSAGAECAVDDLPLFRLRVEELWPDRAEHRREIRELFGRDSLKWWGELSRAEKRRQTEARGLEYWPRLNTRQKTEERERRAKDLIGEVDCNYGLNVWCRWTPTHSGYYKLVAAGAWTTKKWNDRTPRQEFRKRALLKELEDPAKRDEFKDVLADLGWDPVDVGLDESLTGFLDFPEWGERGEVVYSLAGGRCPARDFRVQCGSASASVNYTETEFIGIVVHEVRVATRSPNT